MQLMYKQLTQEPADSTVMFITFNEPIIPLIANHYFVVPYEWAHQQAEQHGYADIDAFMDGQDLDATDALYAIAKETGCIIEEGDWSEYQKGDNSECPCGGSSCPKCNLRESTHNQTTQNGDMEMKDVVYKLRSWAESDKPENMEDAIRDVSEGALLMEDAADLVDLLRAELTTAKARAEWWQKAHTVDCAELQGIRNHLSLTLAQRNEELLQAKAEATRYRETLEDIERDDIDTGETDMEWGLRLQRYARNALKGGE